MIISLSKDHQVRRGWLIIMNRYSRILRVLHDPIAGLGANEDGQTTVEYAVATTFVIIVAVAGFTILQPKMIAFFTALADTLATAASSI